MVNYKILQDKIVNTKFEKKLLIERIEESEVNRMCNNGYFLVMVKSNYFSENNNSYTQFIYFFKKVDSMRRN